MIDRELKINTLKIKLASLKKDIKEEYRKENLFLYDVIVQAKLYCEYECGIKNKFTRKAKKIEDLETEIYKLEGINYPVHWRTRVLAMKSFIKNGEFKTVENIKRAATFLTFLQKKLKESEIQERFVSDLSESIIHKENKSTFEEIIKNILSGGESKSVEFKSTLRWNIKSSKIDNEILFECIKTISAFVNTGGGILLIGVSNNGEPLGLKYDKFKNRDKFLLYLYNIVRDSLGQETASLIDTQIDKYDGKDICLIQCKKSPRPIFCNFKGKGEKFYIRVGPSSIKLSPSEIHHFIIDNFSGL